MRIMGLDFGSKTVGVAISDPLLITAQGIEIIRRKDENKLRQTLARIEELIVERLTTVAADKAMMEAGIRREHRKEYVDKIAAVFILQGYLDYRANRLQNAADNLHEDANKEKE